MDRILTVFDDARATAVLTTLAEAPNLVAEVGRLRVCRLRPRRRRRGTYGLDDYYRYLVVIDMANGAVVAGTRLGFGKEIVEDRGWSALYTAR